jgi:hypothetical protein
MISVDAWEKEPRMNADGHGKLRCMDIRQNDFGQNDFPRVCGEI